MNFVFHLMCHASQNPPPLEFSARLQGVCGESPLAVSGEKSRCKALCDFDARKIRLPKKTLLIPDERSLSLFKSFLIIF